MKNFNNNLNVSKDKSMIVLERGTNHRIYKKRSMRDKLKNYLLAGFLVWLPLGVTIWIITSLFQAINQIVPNDILLYQFFGYQIPGVGVIVVLIIILLTGIIATNVAGQKIINLWNKILFRIPIIKSIYKGIKQVSDSLLSSNGNAFSKAVLIKFPHTDAWTVAFLTSNVDKKIFANTKNKLNSTNSKDANQEINIFNYEEDYINVYVPTTPNPTSGYFIMIAKNNVIELNMSVDEALRYVLSMGTVSANTNKQDL